MRLQHSLNQWLSVSFELAAFSAHRKSNYENQSTIAEANGTQYIYKSNIHDFTLEAQGLIPAVGLQAGKKLGRRLRGEVHLSGGPLFARCRYFSVFSDFPGSDLGDVYEEFLSEGTLEEKGRGTGIALTVGAGLKWLLKYNSGFFLEADYAYRKVRRLAGPGCLKTRDTVEEWSGEWWIKDTYREQPWGIFHMEFPSNYWPEEQLQRRLRRFELDLSGLEVRVGFFFRL